MIALLFVAAALLPAQNQSIARGRLNLSVVERDSDLFVTVHANDVPLERVIRHLAGHLELNIIGEEYLLDQDRVDLYLEDRPLSDAVNWILGSVGYRGRITSTDLYVMADTAPFPKQSELNDLAETAYLRALKRSPTHHESAGAEWSLARIQEDRGELMSATKHYDYLVTNTPNSPLVPDALMKAGAHLNELEEYSLAADHYRDLADIQSDHSHHATARRLLARTMCLMGDPKKGLHILRSLETGFPTQDPAVVRARLLVRARALALTGDSISALRVLELAATYDLSSEQKRESKELYAIALEHSGRLGEAAVAWMGVAKETTGRLQERALKEAARLSLAAGDELGVVMIEAWATQVGLGESVREQATAARERLGIGLPDIQGLTAEQIILRSSELIRTSHFEEARRILQPLFDQRNKLNHEQLLQTTLALATAYEGEERVESAITTLRWSIDLLPMPDDRNRIYSLAADIYERAGNIDDALNAIQGRL